MRAPRPLELLVRRPLVALALFLCVAGCFSRLIPQGLLRATSPASLSDVCPQALAAPWVSLGGRAYRVAQHSVWRGGSCQACLWECMLSGSAGRHGRAVVQALGAAVRPPQIGVGHHRWPPPERPTVAGVSVQQTSMGYVMLAYSLSKNHLT